MNFCPNCGKENVDKNAFCPHCGTNLTGEVVNSGTQQNASPQSGNISAKATGVIAYLTWIGFFVAIIAGDQNSEFAKFHINQALVLNIASIACAIVMYIPILGWIVGIIGSLFAGICWIMAFYYACTNQIKAVPFFGQFKILN